MNTSILSESFHLGDRNRTDGCPGALRMHAAQDGRIGRLRFPGGQLRPHHWETLADLADTFGDGNIHLTSRGNLQIRGITQDERFTQAVQDAGLLPSPAHDRIRNIIASPLGFHTHRLAEQLDQALLDRAEVTSLSGRTLFGIDSGQGDILGQDVDFGALDCGENYHLILGGELTGVACSPSSVVAALVELAVSWAGLRGTAWRVRERPELHAALLADIAHYTTAVAVPEIQQPAAHPIGWFEVDHAVHLGAGLRFGVLSSQLARMIAVIGVPVTVTPWHSLIIHGLSEAVAEQVVRVLAPLGLIFDADSPWLRVSACTGAPGCAKSPADTRTDATQYIALGVVEDGKVHFSGCQRRCGHPLGAYTDYLATAEHEYEVTQR